MADIDLAEAVGAAVLHGNRTGGHLRNVSLGVVVIDYESILEAALPVIREQLARQIEGKHLGPDSGRGCDGNEPPDAAERQAFDRGLHEAAMLVRGGESGD